MLRTFFIAVLCCVVSVDLWGLGQRGEDRISRHEYIAQWKDVAISNMEQYGIPASIILAQGILESASGNSRLARKANNHFGIKCHGWQGKKVYHDDDRRQECFRKYSSASESFQDHAVFLSTKNRYAFLFDLKSDDYKGWARGLKRAGYATNPRYPQLLIKIIEDHRLYDYDNQKTVKKREKEERPETEADRLPEPVYSQKELDSERRENPVKHRREEVIAIGYTTARFNDRIRYTRAREGDTPEKLAAEFDLGPWQIRKYNDLPKDYRFAAGDRVFLQPKRRKNKQRPRVVLTEEQTLWEVSQNYGVKLKFVQRYNPHLPVQAKLAPGTTVHLRKP